MNINKEVKETILQSMDFVFLRGGKVKMGTSVPLVCSMEGHRKNETPVRIKKVKSFWICRFLVSNADFEIFMPKHSRPSTSNEDLDPVTDVTYGEAFFTLNIYLKNMGLILICLAKKSGFLQPHPSDGNMFIIRRAFPIPRNRIFFIRRDIIHLM